MSSLLRNSTLETVFRPRFLTGSPNSSAGLVALSGRALPVGFGQGVLWRRGRFRNVHFLDILQARKKSTKIKFLGPETARWGGGLPREGVVAENFVPALETLSSLGFEERNPGCPGNFAGMSWTPGGVQKVCAKKLRAHFSFPNSREFIDSRSREIPDCGKNKEESDHLLVEGSIEFRGVSKRC